jgi:hypothetical protein
MWFYVGNNNKYNVRPLISIDQKMPQDVSITTFINSSGDCRISFEQPIVIPLRQSSTLLCPTMC